MKTLMMAGFVAALLSAPLAHADTADDHFVALMSQQGEQGSVDQLGAPVLISEAHAVCADLANGGNMMGEIPAAMGAVPGLSPHGASALVGAAHFAYCP